MVIRSDAEALEKKVLDMEKWANRFVRKNGFDELPSRPLDEDSRRHLDHREITEDMTLINASVQVRVMSPALALALALDLGLGLPLPLALALALTLALALALALALTLALTLTLTLT